ncbi:MAG: hypothetical protein KDC32_01655, partial [Saprospiraceae bacterium]|nr:hypothetical protein [Saprospiraceae bacterium]
MKRIFLFALLALAICDLQAQDQTVFNRANRFGVFVSPMFEQGPLNEPWRTSAGGGLGFVFGDFFLGAYGLAGLDYDQLLADEEVDRIDLAHGGLWIGYTPEQHRILHPYAATRIGFGAVDIDVDYLDDDGFGPDPWDLDDDDLIDNVFVVNPEIGLELNITSFLRIAAAGGYRWVEGVNGPGLDDDAFTGWTGTL